MLGKLFEEEEEAGGGKGGKNVIRKSLYWIRSFREVWVVWEQSGFGKKGVFFERRKKKRKMGGGEKGLPPNGEK